ncbi:hypothetical protein BJF96_g159 [Verticillium dahliae]|uniref:Uncharacterized protein n=1 Tax=Verticillium dahliae TaxID=27337 RepID=A0AA44WTQ6_VERDA|nr:hypothetical protein BJF96_g159 [Verticillium dahliae]
MMTASLSNTPGFPGASACAQEPPLARTTLLSTPLISGRAYHEHQP